MDARDVLHREADHRKSRQGVQQAARENPVETCEGKAENQHLDPRIHTCLAMVQLLSASAAQVGTLLLCPATFAIESLGPRISLTNTQRYFMDALKMFRSLEKQRTPAHSVVRHSLRRRRGTCTKMRFIWAFVHSSAIFATNLSDTREVGVLCTSSIVERCFRS